ncbi:hypothetical protein HYALB_00009432 [Hymenoscyphus albidus]|uniref:Uncharacterized protein n=1 Tax=Hymenoscyphus albidus TaxID=595503 RepID=A0A9N9LNE2_9HELO|nr:hypothetical protein HYALB_00009432 [Hymenoscyphus albidus]
MTLAATGSPSSELKITPTSETGQNAAKHLSTQSQSGQASKPHPDSPAEQTDDDDIEYPHGPKL